MCARERGEPSDNIDLGISKIVGASQCLLNQSLNNCQVVLDPVVQFLRQKSALSFSALSFGNVDANLNGSDDLAVQIPYRSGAAQQDQFELHSEVDRETPRGRFALHA